MLISIVNVSSGLYNRYNIRRNADTSVGGQVVPELSSVCALDYAGVYVLRC